MAYDFEGTEQPLAVRTLDMGGGLNIKVQRVPFSALQPWGGKLMEPDILQGNNGETTQVVPLSDYPGQLDHLPMEVRAEYGNKALTCAPTPDQGSINDFLYLKPSEPLSRLRFNLYGLDLEVDQQVELFWRGTSRGMFDMGKRMWFMVHLLRTSVETPTPENPSAWTTGPSFRNFWNYEFDTANEYWPYSTIKKRLIVGALIAVSDAVPNFNPNQPTPLGDTQQEYAGVNKTLLDNIEARVYDA